ncbi:YbbR-like domain-containing protein [Lactococcus cremoris]|uniref:CdaR family protein n=1 Tax=Lactococcus lactis subsp. cremoris TaxID=1359 RepID=UPI00300E6449
MANKFFNSKTFYILASVFFAIVLFFNANATSIRNQGTNQSGEVYTATINNVPVELKYNSNKYFVSGYNSSATVHLSGYNRLSITNEENSDTRNFFLSVDLTKLKTGKFDVPIRIEQLPGGVTATIEPKTMNITVEDKAKKEFEVTPKADSTQLPEGFTIDSLTVSDEKVKVTAGNESIQKIYAIEAALPNDVNLTENYSGTVTLHAVDSAGKILPAQIEPSTTHLKVTVNKLTKDVPVKITQKGTLDKTLSEVKTKISDKNVTLSGEKSALDAINSVEGTVDITGIVKETKITVPLHAAGGSLDPQEVEVTLTPVKIGS